MAPSKGIKKRLGKTLNKKLPAELVDKVLDYTEGNVGTETNKFAKTVVQKYGWQTYRASILNPHQKQRKFPKKLEDKLPPEIWEKIAVNIPREEDEFRYVKVGNHIDDIRHFGHAPNPLFWTFNSRNVQQMRLPKNFYRTFFDGEPKLTNDSSIQTDPENFYQGGI